MNAEQRLNQYKGFMRTIRNTSADLKILQSDIDRAEDERQSRLKERDEAVLQVGMIKQSIKLIADQKLREVLERHYLRGQTWEQIADEMNYSPVYIYKLRKQAHEEFEKAEKSIVECIEC